MKKTNGKRALALNRLTVTRLKASGASPGPGYWWNRNMSYDDGCSGSCHTCIDGQCGSWESDDCSGQCGWY